MAQINYDMEIQKGSTFLRVLRWETAPVVYKPIVGISQTAPARVTVPSHGIPEGWPVAVVSVKGMKEINARHNPPWASDYYIATVISADMIELNDINATGFKAYRSGGYVQFNSPMDTAGYTARMSIKNRVGGTELLRLTSMNGRIIVDSIGKAITLEIAAADTEAITWKKGVYDLELVSPAGEVTALMSGKISISEEVTAP